MDSATLAAHTGEKVPKRSGVGRGGVLAASQQVRSLTLQIPAGSEISLSLALSWPRPDLIAPLEDEHAEEKDNTEAAKKRRGAGSKRVLDQGQRSRDRRAGDRTLGLSTRPP